MGREPLDLLRGTLDLLILKILSWGPSHGYGIARSIEQCSSEALDVEEGSLYPALHKLEDQGLITAEWGTTANNRRAKYYRLTTAGKKQLRAARDDWSRFAGAVFQILALEDHPK
jgi:PadR family transcriptional regulator PadR